MEGGGGGREEGGEDGEIRGREKGRGLELLKEFSPLLSLT